MVSRSIRLKLRLGDCCVKLIPVNLTETPYANVLRSGSEWIVGYPEFACRRCAGATGGAATRFAVAKSPSHQHTPRKSPWGKCPSTHAGRPPQGARRPFGELVAIAGDMGCYSPESVQRGVEA